MIMSLKINAAKSRIMFDRRNRMNNFKLYVKVGGKTKEGESISWQNAN